MILFIEDNISLVNFIKEVLANEEIVHVTTLKDAIKFLDKNTPSIMFVDLGLPDSSGLDTLRALTEYSIPKVVITASLNLNKEIVELGAVDFVAKTNPSEILSRIKFNINKQRVPVIRRRIKPDNFELIKSYLRMPELTTV